MKTSDVIIIGASFAGLACAKAASQLGLSTLVLERKADVGKGLNSTGILVHEASDLVNVPSHLTKPINQVRLYSPSLRSIEIKSDTYLFQATDTPGLMRHLLEDAKAAGVSVMLDTALENASDLGDKVEVNDGLAQGRFLVGADGPRSRVAEVFNLSRNETFLLGVEAEYDGVETSNDQALHCFLNQTFAAGYLGWIIPGPKHV